MRLSDDPYRNVHQLLQRRLLDCFVIEREGEYHIGDQKTAACLIAIRRGQPVTVRTWAMMTPSAERATIMWIILIIRFLGVPLIPGMRITNPRTITRMTSDRAM